MKKSFLSNISIKKRCQIYLFSYSRLRLTLQGVLSLQVFKWKKGVRFIYSLTPDCVWHGRKKKGVRFIYYLTPDCVWRGREFLFLFLFWKKVSDLFILLLPTAFDAIGSFYLWKKGVRFIYSLTPKKKVSDLFIILLPTVKKRCQIYLFPYSRLRLTRLGVFVFSI
jgi:hypothetical protein